VVDRDYADYTSDVVLGSRREQVRKVSYSSLFCRRSIRTQKGLASTKEIE
jgi:hypothetical protein